MSHHRSSARRIRLLAATLACLMTSLLVGSTVPASAHGDESTTGTAADLHSRDGAGQALAQLRHDLAPYADVHRALADGFVPVSDCTSSPAGAMGVHFLNPARAMAPVDPTKPAILLYLPTGDGGYQLLGAEWFQADADQDLSTDGDRPTLWGRPFNGPMLGHEPGMPIHYDLHVWLFQANPDGVFAPWNPSVHC
ncbi:hypothetical protein [Nocardioides pocheonensis]|uniref:Uncharacterized protein n=1 Tax=Nocardioides pocheonensis TaxID=661485 RepID=A0A3N0GFW2_9ACTN|nr:hypothetical protein [Nocardioides pocheonensis]RNM11106.1 hypothetical protein EFL26_23460 [Nocardioides pocheonensis]